MKKVAPSFPATSRQNYDPVKIEILPPSFWKFAWRLNPPPQLNGAGGAQSALCINKVMLIILMIILIQNSIDSKAPLM